MWVVWSIAGLISVSLLISLIETPTGMRPTLGAARKLVNGISFYLIANIRMHQHPEKARNGLLDQFICTDARPEQACLPGCAISQDSDVEVPIKVPTMLKKSPPRGS
jgi:hypothetical protein